MENKKALITGITGQDGSYLAELLLSKGYEVHGVIRPVSKPNLENISGLSVRLHYGDLLDQARLIELVEEIGPDEVYNLGAQSHVGRSFESPIATMEATGIGCLHMLEATRRVKGAKFYQASSSEIFGESQTPQNEQTRFHPRSPYAIAKAYAFYMTQNYRERGMFAVNGILFNHESERRPEQFVSRKISKAVARIKLGLQHELHLGNAYARRDWGYAPEYVEAMWRMLQIRDPQDLVIATGQTHSVRDFVHAAFTCIGIRDYEKHVKYGCDVRPTDVSDLMGDASTAARVISWAPQVRFTELVVRMIAHDLVQEGK
jgi:GDPmannose 4,6-dehydratase